MRAHIRRLKIPEPGLSTDPFRDYEFLELEMSRETEESETKEIWRLTGGRAEGNPKILSEKEANSALASIYWNLSECIRLDPAPAVAAPP